MMRYEQDPRMDKEDRAVVEALGRVGLRVESVYDLVNTNKPYPEAIPVLIEMLPKVQNDRIKEGIARALTVKEARPLAAKPLIKEFLMVAAETEGQKHTKWAIGNALARVADDSVFEEIASILADRGHGWARSAIVSALSRMKKHREEAFHLLIELLSDEDKGTVAEAISVLGRLRVRGARPQVEAFLQDPNSEIRQRAKRALAAIDKSA